MASASGVSAAALSAAKFVTDVVGSVLRKKSVDRQEELRRRQLSQILIQEVEQAQIRQAQRAIALADTVSAAQAVAGSAGVAASSVDALRQTSELMSEIDRRQDEIVMQGIFDRYAVGMVESANAQRVAKIQTGIDIAGSAFGTGVDITQTSIQASSRVTKD